MKETNIEHIKPVLKSLIAYIEDRAMNRGYVQQPTGFLEIDHCLKGLRNGELWCIASRPAMGKSAFMMNLLLNTLLLVEDKRPVLIFTGMAGAMQYSLRMMSSVAMIPLNHLDRGELADEEWSKLSLGIHKLAGLPLYINDNVRTLGQVEALVESCTRKHGIAPIVAIDDINCLHLRDAGFFARQSREVVSRLKSMAMGYPFPLVFTTNITGEADNRPDSRPQLRDIEHIHHYEELVDKILLLHREEVYQENTARKGLAEIIIGKNRMGPIANILLAYKPEYARFETHHYAYTQAEGGEG